MACTFYVYAIAPSGKNAALKPLYNEIMQILNEFEVNGVEKERLAQIKGMAEAESVFALKCEWKSSQLASNGVFLQTRPNTGTTRSTT